MKIEKPERKKTAKKIVTVTLLLIVILSALSFGLGHARQKEIIPIQGAAYLSSTPNVNVTANVTIDAMSYLDQPTQFYWTGLNGSFPGETIVRNSDYLLNASGYQIFNNNKSTTAQTTPSYADFSMGPYLGSNISYLYSDSRIALNGSTTFYEVLSEKNFAALPTGAGNSSIIYFKATYAAGNYSVSYNYFNSAGYQTGTFSKLIHPLQFYQFFVLVESSATVMSIMQGGQTVDTVTLGASNLSSIISAKASGSSLYSEYMTEAAASTTNTSMILNFGYLVDHSTYNITQTVSSNYLQTNGAANSVISGTLNSLEPFDPGTANASFVGVSNKTTNYGHHGVNQSDFKNVTVADSNISIASSHLNASLKVGNITKNVTIRPNQAFTTLALTNETNSSVTASLELYSWNSTYVSEAIHSFMRNYVSGLIAKEGYNIGPNQVTIANYIIANLSFDQHYGNNTANAIRAEVDNAFAADLASVNLTLVNSTTNAIVAGAFAGDFYFGGMAIHPVIQGSNIMNPATGAAYSSPSAAGFAAGAYISSQGAVIVPSYKLVNGNPGEFSIYGFALPSLGFGQSTLTSAGTAVSNFFHQAAPTNTVKSSSGSPTPTLIGTMNDLFIKPVTSTASGAYNTLSSDVSHTVSQAMPLIGGTVSNIKTGFGSDLKTVKGDLGQASAAATAGLLTGANDIKTTAYSLGEKMYNTANGEVSTAHAVLSSLYQKGSSAAKSLVGDGVKALDTVGGAASNAWSKISGAVISAGGAISKGAHSAFSWLSSIGATIGHILEYVGIGVLVVVIIVVFLLLVKNREEDGEDATRDFTGNEGPNL